jgi:hypothetical protein
MVALLVELNSRRNRKQRSVEVQRVLRPRVEVTEFSLRL